MGFLSRVHQTRRSAVLPDLSDPAWYQAPGFMFGGFSAGGLLAFVTSAGRP